MVVLGVDPHKQTYTVVAVDQTGRQLAQLTVSARTDGQLRLLGGHGSCRLARAASAAGRWRTAARWPAGWSPSCCGLGRRWSGCHPS
jgi:hypothetical protein